MASSSFSGSVHSGLFGIVLGGWASNSHYSLIGALRSTAQLVSYETAAGLAVISGLLLAGTFQIRSIVDAQQHYGVWFIFLAPVAFFIYLVASIAETNRAPFDLPEAESELVAGYMTEYSGFRWALYFLGEYANMIVVGAVATTLFLGGWLRPFPNVHWLNWLDILPALFTAAVGVYCVYRAGKQPVRVQTWFMWGVAILCFLVAANSCGHSISLRRCKPPSRVFWARFGSCSRLAAISMFSCGCGLHCRATASTSSCTWDGICSYPWRS